jgi:hypothetical protein
VILKILLKRRESIHKWPLGVLNCVQLRDESDDAIDGVLMIMSGSKVVVLHLLPAAVQGPYCFNVTHKIMVTYTTKSFFMYWGCPQA